MYQALNEPLLLDDEIDAEINHLLGPYEEGQQAASEVSAGCGHDDLMTGNFNVA